MSRSDSASRGTSSPSRAMRVSLCIMRSVSRGSLLRTVATTSTRIALSGRARNVNRSSVPRSAACRSSRIHTVAAPADARVSAATTVSQNWKA